ncbi:MAG: oligosaccharide flippase family protein [Myxococcota bacterium]
MSSPGRFLARASLGVGGLQVASLILVFGSAIALARILGEDGYGAYSYATTWSLVLLGPATFGLGPIATRETAAAIELGNPGRIKAVRAFAARTTAIASVVVIAAGLVALAVARPWIDPRNVAPLRVALPMTAASATLLVCRHLLLGHRRVFAAQLAESVVRPLIVLVGVGALWALGPGVDATGAVWVYAAASLVAAGFLFARLRRETSQALRDAAPDADPTWLRAAMPLLLTGLARDLNAEASVLIMGSLVAPDDVGLFRAAQRLASIPTFVLSAVNLVFQPVAAGLFAKGDLAAIEVLGVRASRVAVAISLPVLVVYWFEGRWVLSLFGPAFVDAAPALGILALGHLFNVACGSVGVILVACKREDDAARGLVMSCVVTLIANGVLIRSFGLNGAAIATSLGLVVWNVALSWFTWQRLHIVPAAFSWRRLRW